MFCVECAACGGEVLLTSRRIRELRNTPEGVEVDWLCWSGHQGTWRAYSDESVTDAPTAQPTEAAPEPATEAAAEHAAPAVPVAAAS